MIHQLKTELWVPYSIDEVWHFASDPQNLAGISPPQHKVKVEGPSIPFDGAEVRIALSPYGLPLKLSWLSTLSEVVATGDQRRFTDIQSSGPFAYWKHCHIFEAGAPKIAGSRGPTDIPLHKGGTWIKDELEYSMPFSFAGELAHRLFVRKSVEDLFYFRTEALRKNFPA